MLKLLLSTALILSLSPFTHAELTLSEKVRPMPKSLVNLNIERLALPPTPNNMTLPEFGKGIIGWGSGPEGAENRLNTLTKADVEKYKTQDVTLEMIQTWHMFYNNETQRNAGNPTAPLRAQLMKKIMELW